MEERLSSQESEFKNMQETLTFKESEMEVLKDCFLQLKSFQEKEGDGEEDIQVSGGQGCQIWDQSWSDWYKCDKSETFKDHFSVHFCSPS